jgi:hypothetical protein
VLLRIGGGKEIDRSKLALAVEAMTATLNGSVGDLSTAKATASTPINGLKRPSDSALEGQSMIKRSRVAEDSVAETTMLSPISKAMKQLFPRLGKSTLESRQSCVLNWSEETAVFDAAMHPLKQRRTRLKHLRVCNMLGPLATLFLLLKLWSEC